MDLYGEQRIDPLTRDTITFFPTPEKLAGETLQTLTVPRTKKAAIIALAQQVASGDIHFSSYQNPQAFKNEVMEIRGIGPWTAEYIALRAIGDTDAFPEGYAYLDKIIGTKAIDNLSPWRGYLATGGRTTKRSGGRPICLPSTWRTSRAIWLGAKKPAQI
jgi:AraC family transcriptional regulator of adaptative response / DNA-3-methyladenine glycosylase II